MSICPGLRTIKIVQHEPFVLGGISYGGATVIQQFSKIKRASRGWRRHLRRKKAKQK